MKHRVKRGGHKEETKVCGKSRVSAPVATELADVSHDLACGRGMTAAAQPNTAYLHLC